MNVIASLFLYTPFPWVFVMYVAAYRHDLGRVMTPFSDASSPTEWWSVCSHLGLVGAEVKKPKEPFLGSRFTSSSFLVFVLLGSLWAFIPFPLAWYFLCALQVAAALPLFAVIVRYRAGPFPFKPYRDVMPYPRLGSRVRHLDRGFDAERREGSVKRASIPTPNSSGGVAS